MSQYRQQLLELSYATSQGVQAYANVHGYIDKEGASAKSALKNLFGRGVPMSELLAAAESLVPVWTDIESAVLSFEAQHVFLLDDEERTYLDPAHYTYIGIRGPACRLSD